MSRAYEGLCLRCGRHSDVFVLGDWHPPWALCPSCAAEVDAPDVGVQPNG